MALSLSTGFLAALADDSGITSLLQRGVIELYDGVRPAAASGKVPTDCVLLGVITGGGVDHVPNTPTGGLEWVATVTYTEKNPSQDWKFTGLANGTPTWFRIKGNSPDDGGNNYSLIRIDGDVGIEGDVTAEFVFPTTIPTIEKFHTYSLSNFQIFFPN